MNRTVETIQERQEKKRTILDFFATFLSPNKVDNIINSNVQNSIGNSEPTIPANTLHSVTEYLKEKNSMLNSKFNGSATSISNFAPIFQSKRQKVNTWRQMYQYPEINRATNIILNEALARDENNDILKLRFHQIGEAEIPIAIQEIMNTAFNMLIHDIYDIEKNIYSLFRKFLIEGEIYIELLHDQKTNSINSINVLPSYSMAPILKDDTNDIIGYTQYEDVIINYYQDTEPEYDDVMGVSHKVYLGEQSYGVSGLSGEPIEFLPNQIAYANMGSYSNSIYEVDGYYSSIRKVYNMLSIVDDALAIYRFVRAPETRLWNIYTGNLPPTKVDNYLQNVITEFRKDFNYNPSTGEINQDSVFNSIIDDYFFASDGSGMKTSVETLSGAMNLDQLNDIQYYQEKLYTGLKIPKYMWDPTVEVSVNSTRDSVRSDEMELTYFIEQLQNNFVSIFEGPFELLCRVLGVNEKYLSKKYYSISFARRNSWKFWQDKAKFSAQIEMYAAAKDLIWHPEENPTGWAAPKFIREKCFDFSANDWQVNEELLEEYKATFNTVKSNIESWNNTVPNPTEKFEYGTEYVYGQTDDTTSETSLNDVVYDSDKFKYDNEFTYGSSPENIDTNVLDTIKPFEPENIIRPQFNYGTVDNNGDSIKDINSGEEYWFNNAYTYGNIDHEDTEDTEITDSIDEFTNDKIDYDSEYQQYIYNQSYLYGLEAEQVKNALSTEDDILDVINFTEKTDVINDTDFITTFDKFMFGNVYSYGTNNEHIINNIDNQSDDDIKFNYGDDFKYGV